MALTRVLCFTETNSTMAAHFSGHGTAPASTRHATAFALHHERIFPDFIQPNPDQPGIGQPRLSCP